jgi:hypothetical protein
MVTYGNLRTEAVSEQVDKKTYSFYPLKHNRKVTMTLRQRFIPDKVFFGSYEDDENNVAASVLKALMKVRPMQCDIDTRKSLIGKIVVSGGCSMIPGYVERLEEEILELIEHKDFDKLKKLKKYMKVKEATFPRNIMAWVGGSIVSTLQGIEKFAILAEKYKEEPLTDLYGSYYLFANRPSISEIYKTTPADKKRISMISP